MNSQNEQSVAELKSERVQDGLAVAFEEDPFWISLKSERVQDGLAAGMVRDTTTVGLSSFKPMTLHMPQHLAGLEIHGFGLGLFNLTGFLPVVGKKEAGGKPMAPETETMSPPPVKTAG